LTSLRRAAFIGAKSGCIQQGGILARFTSVLIAIVCAVFASASVAQIQNIFVGKKVDYSQTSDTGIGGASYAFRGAVEGKDLQGLATPTMTGPINYAALGASYPTTGALVYNPGPGWYFAPTGSQEWRYPSQAAMDAAFGGGTYTLIVNGTAIPLNLSGDAYPNPPHATLGGGTWSNGKYVIDPSKALTITTDAFTGFTSHLNGLIQVYYGNTNQQQWANTPAKPANFATFTIPAGTFPANTDQQIYVSFTSFMDDDGGPHLGAANTAWYQSSNTITVTTSTASATAGPPISSVSLRKTQKYAQTSPTDITPDTGNTAVFHADVDGTGIAGITAPTISGPFNVSAIGAAHNGGVLTFNAADGGWRYGANAHDYGTASAAQLNNLFPDGTYTFTVNGASVPLTLAGNAYPQATATTLTGGSWSDGAYVISRDQPLTVNTGPFAGYGSHFNDLICVYLSGPGFVADSTIVTSCPGQQQQSSTTPGSNSMSYTFPANTLASGQQYTLNVVFHAVVDGRSISALPGSNNNAGYVAHTRIALKATEPVFPMTVTSSITSSGLASASAQIQFRPQDVGTQGSVYVFAVAPATIVKDAFAAKRVPGDPFANYSWTATGGSKDNLPVQCVLAQLSASGQLVGVSASSLQAYVSGVLGAQGVAVTILNGVPTVNIAGATFYVGYGSSAAAMLNGGLNRSAVTIQGASTCQPKPPQTGWWWNPLEDGRGFSVEVQGNHLFFAAFLYDATGRSTWYVASGSVSLDGTLFSDTLYSAKGGQSLGAAYPGFPQLTNEGPITLSFNSASNGSIVWPGGAVPVQRFPMVPNGLAMPKAANAPESGWWWNAAESGRGFFMEWQGNTLDVAGYVYDDQGNPIWVLTYLTASGDGAIGQTLAGSWWTYADGQTLTSAYKPNRQVTNNFAPVSIQFTSSTTAVMTLTNGRTTTLTRQLF
jgi:hypothetical protein